MAVKSELEKSTTYRTNSVSAPVHAKSTWRTLGHLFRIRFPHLTDNTEATLPWGAGEAPFPQTIFFSSSRTKPVQFLQPWRAAPSVTKGYASLNNIDLAQGASFSAPPTPPRRQSTPPREADGGHLLYRHMKNRHGSISRACTPRTTHFFPKLQ